MKQEVGRNHPCDRCGHRSYQHAVVSERNVSSECRVMSERATVFGAKEDRRTATKKCYCDGYVPA